MRYDCNVLIYLKIIQTMSKSLANNISKPISKPLSRQTNVAIEIMNENRKFKVRLQRINISTLKLSEQRPNR